MFIENSFWNKRHAGREGMTTIVGMGRRGLNAHSCLSLAHFSLLLEETRFFAHTGGRIKAHQEP
ncbi:hypothetical protein ACOZ0N_002064 [Cronobacter muytjensii]|uniref:hypothetical protein n=1 Tax=Cronobacter muytjensii TaxID=413501 RepID=UPI0029E3E2B0|nr:hypothetical protein [Cronobacter muytjensii]ELY3984245.1 hypothetical protein [Cronobacter muytjensii]ELY4661667.1 hypothetical protein [Cronobacter muytjensii]